MYMIMDRICCHLCLYAGAMGIEEGDVGVSVMKGAVLSVKIGNVPDFSKKDICFIRNPFIYNLILHQCAVLSIAIVCYCQKYFSVGRYPASGEVAAHKLPPSILSTRSS